MAKTWQQHVSVACQAKRVLLDVVHAPWKQKWDKDKAAAAAAVDVNLQRIVMTLLLNDASCVFLWLNMLFYSTCNFVKCFKTVIQSDDIQERDSAIFKSSSGKKKNILAF